MNSNLNNQNNQMYGINNNQMYGINNNQMNSSSNYQMYGSSNNQPYNYNNQMYGSSNNQMYGSSNNQMYGSSNNQPYNYYNQMYNRSSNQNNQINSIYQPYNYHNQKGRRNNYYNQINPIYQPYNYHNQINSTYQSYNRNNQRLKQKKNRYHPYQKRKTITDKELEKNIKKNVSKTKVVIFEKYISGKEKEKFAETKNDTMIEIALKIEEQKKKEEKEEEKRMSKVIDVIMKINMYNYLELKDTKDTKDRRNERYEEEIELYKEIRKEKKMTQGIEKKIENCYMNSIKLQMNGIAEKDNKEIMKEIEKVIDKKKIAKYEEFIVKNQKDKKFNDKKKKKIEELKRIILDKKFIEMRNLIIKIIMYRYIELKYENKYVSQQSEKLKQDHAFVVKKGIELLEEMIEEREITLKIENQIKKFYLSNPYFRNHLSKSKYKETEGEIQNIIKKYNL